MSTKKPALGRGLSALLNDADIDLSVTKSNYKLSSQSSLSSGTQLVHVSLIETNPYQPRTDFEKHALAELVTSIKTHGLIQPITVRALSDGKFQIISGERRFRASQLSGLDEVPVFVREADDQAMLEMAIVENIQRQDLNAIEVSLSFKRLMDECHLSQEELSDKVGKDRSTVANYIRLLNLPDVIQVAIRDRKISMGHARAILSIENEAEQIEALEQIIKNGLSVRKVEQLAKSKKSSTTIKSELSIDEKRVQEELSFHFKTKIGIKKASNGKGGNISIKFANEEELKRIINLLDK